MTKGSEVLLVAEPPAQYLVRPPAVIDCSVFAALVFNETGRDQALAQMRGKALHAPFLMEVEITSVARKKRQHGHEALALEGIRHFESADLMLHAIKPSEVLELASRYDLTSYDASYLWLAAEFKCPLLTFDLGLGKAAKTHLASLP